MRLTLVGFQPRRGTTFVVSEHSTIPAVAHARRRDIFRFSPGRRAGALALGYNGDAPTGLFLHLASEILSQHYVRAHLSVKLTAPQ